MKQREREKLSGRYIKTASKTTVVCIRVIAVNMERFEGYLRNKINSISFYHDADIFYFCIKANITPSRKFSWLPPASRAIFSSFESQ